MPSLDCLDERHDACVWCSCECHLPVLDDEDVHGLAALGKGLLVTAALVGFVVVVGVAAGIAWAVMHG